MRVRQRIVQIIESHPGLAWSLMALLVYTLTTFVMMYPVPFRLDSVIAGMGNDGDAYRYTWTLWWAKETILNPGLGLTHLDLLNHPVGIELVFMLTGVAVNLQALPFSLLFSPAFTYNVQILLSFIVAGMAMYWFCTEVTGDHKAGLVGGFIFAFFPNKTGHVLAGHLPQVTVCWVPLYALFLWRTLRRPTWRTGLPAALTLAFACLVHVIHLPYLVLPVTVYVFLMALVEMGRAFFDRRRLGILTLTYGLAALLTVPFLLPTVLHFGKSPEYVYKTGVIASSADGLAFLTPSRYNPLLEALDLVPHSAERIFHDLGTMREGLVYPGILVVLLALWGLIRRRRDTWLLWALVLVTIVLSLGPLLKVGGELSTIEVDTVQSYITLPYALFEKIPLMNIGRTPSRLNESTMFALAVLAAYGVAELSLLLLDRHYLMVGLLSLTLLGIGLEYVVIWPFPVAPADMPPTIQAIADESGDGALLHLGIERREVHHPALYYQTTASRPIVGGRVHRTLPVVPPWLETLSRLSLPDPTIRDIVPRPTQAERVAWLHYFDIDYVLFHKHTWEWQTPEYREFVQSLLGSPRYQDQSLVAYSIPDKAPDPENPRLYTFGEEGWHPPDLDGDVWRRWLIEDGRLYLYSMGQEKGSLRFNVDSHLDFPILEVYWGEQLLDSFIVDGRTMYTTRPITVTQGMNVFRFRAPGGCELMVNSAHCWEQVLLDSPPEDHILPCDPEAVPTTCRTFVFDQVSFVPERETLLSDGPTINFGEAIQWRSWNLDESVKRPGELLTLTLTWKALTELNNQYIVFVHLLSPEGVLAAQYDEPLVDQMPFSTWPAGMAYSYPVAIALPNDLAPGDYRIVAGVYRWPSLERLPVSPDVPGAEMRAVELETVQISP